jgi:CelD/BcsL family acetyltransferase involved in cellulose biosynthesis
LLDDGHGRGLMTGVERAPEGVGVRLLPLGSAAVEELWQDLHRRNLIRSPFETWEWISALRDVPECSAAIRVAVVDLGGPPVGLLALEWAADDRGLRLVGPAGWRWLVPDHVDVLAAPADRDVVAAAVLQHLVGRRDWDVLDLDGLRPDGALARAVAARGSLWRPRRRPQPVPVPFVDLRTFDLSAPFRSSNLRQQVGRGLRVAQRSGGLSVAEDPEEVAALVDDLGRLHAARFGVVSGLFATAARRRFHRLAAARLAAAGRARIYHLRADGRSAALLYVLRHAKVHYFYTVGTDPSAGLSPGRTVLGQAILAAVREGAEEFDLLRGDHDYKLRFASGVREDIRLRVVRPTPRVVARAAAGLPTRLRARVRGR